MGRELRQRKTNVSYNETWLAFEASAGEPAKDQNADHGAIHRFAKEGIKNTNSSKSMMLASAKLQQQRSKVSTRQSRRRPSTSDNSNEEAASDTGSSDGKQDDDDMDEEEQDDFQAPAQKRRSRKSAYDVDLSNDQSGSSTDSPAAKRSRRQSRGKSAAPVVRRQPGRAAAGKVRNLAEASESEEESSSEDDMSDDQRKESRPNSSRVELAGKGNKQRKPADSDCSMDEAASSGGVTSVSDSEGMSDEESDKENQPAVVSNRQTKGAKKTVNQKPSTKQAAAKQKKTAGKGTKAKPAAKPESAAAKKRSAAVVLSSQSESEESEEASDSEDETQGLQIEKVLDSRPNPTGAKQQEFLVKFHDHSYRKAKWLSRDNVFRHKPQLLRNFQQRLLDGTQDEFGELQNGIHPETLLVERVIAQNETVQGTVYLTKWRGLPYSESTWESLADLKDDKEHVDAFKLREKVPALRERKSASLDTVPTFLNGRHLRDYQEVSLKWMMNNWSQNTNCILGDEMGLGKTAQSISTLEFQRQLCDIPGPFLIIAPLTTLGHWQREIQTWTPMNVVLYNGSAKDREMIRDHEFKYKSGNANNRFGRSAARQSKFNVLLASYEMVRKDKKVFQDIDWETVIVDEAHRLKNTGAAARIAVQNLTIQWLLLLTGTPVQNNMGELFGLMNLLDSEKYEYEEDFLEKFGGGKDGISLEQVQALQAELRPILLRRMKEDVENLPEKEEVVVWVQLTHQQRQYYKALYSNQIGDLLTGCSAKNMPNLRNLAMELRKVCCHPFLCNGLEDDFGLKRHAAGDAGSELDCLIQSSGKMLLLHKLLPKLKAEGHRVLIFSQFKIMMDVLEDSLRLCKYPVERIDGSVSSRDRQAAIDRYSKGGEDSFVFLLSTRAGGQGITLTAADTVIIYDSDWNPQNDLQAMARCHRIGQSKEVTIYRLVCKDTYEQQVFECSSRKYGLDEAILGSMNSCGDPEQDSKKIADLLKYGAHSLVGKEDEAKQEEEAFAAENIDQILAGRTEKRQIGNRKGNTFSTATFASNDLLGPAATGNEREYWAGLMPETVQQHDQLMAAAKAPQVLAPRRRKAVNYNEAKLHRKYASASESEQTAAKADTDGDSSEANDGAEVKTKSKKGGDAAEDAGMRWTLAEVKMVEDRLLALGPNRTSDVREQALQLGLTSLRSIEDIHQLETALQLLIKRAAAIQNAKTAAEQKQRNQELKKALPDVSGNADSSSSDSDDALGSAEAPSSAKETRKEKGDDSDSTSDGSDKESEKAADDKDDLAVSASSQLFTSSIEMKMPSLARKALTSVDVSARISRQGKKFLQQLTEQAALNELMTAVAAGDASAMITLYNITKVLGGTKGLPHWWGPKDDKAVLKGYHRRGGLPWNSRLMLAVADAILGDASLEFSVKLVLKETFTDDGSTSVSQQPSDKADAQTDKQDTAESPPAAPDSAQAGCDSHGAHVSAAEPAGWPDEATAMEGVEGQAANGASGSGAAAAAECADKSEKRVVELDEAAWAGMRTGVVQRLKKLMAAAADPSRVAKDQQAREQQAAAAAKHKAEALQQRRLERQRRRHEQAVNYLYHRKSDAPAAAQTASSDKSPLDLHPVHSQPKPQLPGSLGTAARDIAKQHSKPVTTGASGNDDLARDPIKQQGRGALGGSGSVQQQRPAAPKQQQGATAGSSNDVDDGLTTTKLNASSSGQGRAMNEYMPPITVGKDNNLDKQAMLPREPHSSSQNRQKSSAFKQTTLSFGKKTAAARPAAPVQASLQDDDVVDLSNM